MSRQSLYSLRYSIWDFRILANRPFLSRAASIMYSPDNSSSLFRLSSSSLTTTVPFGAMVVVVVLLLVVEGGVVVLLVVVVGIVVVVVVVVVVPIVEAEVVGESAGSLTPALAAPSTAVQDATKMEAAASSAMKGKERRIAGKVIAPTRNGGLFPWTFPLPSISMTPFTSL